MGRATRLLEPGVRTLQVRATDGRRRAQTTRGASPFPSGSTGYYAIEVLVG